MSGEGQPARYGPFHRRSFGNRNENEKICSSGEVWGRPRGNFYAGLFPAVKAWSGALPDGVVGVEFYTDVPPDPWSPPGWPEWTEGMPGVKTIDRMELVSIPVVVTLRRDME